MKTYITMNQLIGHVLARHRIIADLSTDAVAQHLDITKASYLNIERGSTGVKFSTIHKLCNLMGISVAMYSNSIDQVIRSLNDNYKCIVLEGEGDVPDGRTPMDRKKLIAAIHRRLKSKAYAIKNPRTPDTSGRGRVIRADPWDTMGWSRFGRMAISR